MNSNVIRTLHSRTSVAIGILLVALCCVAVYFSDASVVPPGDRGMAFPSANEWVDSRLWQCVSAFALNVAIIVMMSMLNKWFNMLRSMTYIFALFFAILQAGTPALTASLYTGPVMCIVVVICMMLTLSCYSRPETSSRVFLVFFLLSTALSTQYSYIFYLPAFLIGCGQMRVFSAKTLMAGFLGIVTPWWILMGFGIIKFQDLHLPVFTSIFSGADLGTLLSFLTVVGLTVFLSIVSYLANFIKALAYNAQARARNGMLLVVFLFTLIAMAVDYIDMSAYVTLLNFCAAMLLSQFFVRYRGDRSWIWILVVAAAYIIAGVTNLHG